VLETPLRLTPQAAILLFVRRRFAGTLSGGPTGSAAAAISELRAGDSAVTKTATDKNPLRRTPKIVQMP
jgi:hypothetical protein